MNLAFFMNLRDLDASEIGESRHTRHMEWAHDWNKNVQMTVPGSIIAS